MPVISLGAGPRALPPRYIKAEQGITPKGMESREPVHALGINAGSTASGLTIYLSHTNVTHTQRA